MKLPPDGTSVRCNKKHLAGVKYEKEYDLFARTPFVVGDFVMFGYNRQIISEQSSTV